VTDSYGAGGTDMISVTVNNANESLSYYHLKNASDSLFSAALAKSDSDAAAQVIRATLSEVDKSVFLSDRGTHRELLATNSLSSSFRQNAIKQLLLTFSITPSSQAAFTKLIDVLVKILEAPSEISDSTAIDCSLFFNSVSIFLEKQYRRMITYHLF